MQHRQFGYRWRRRTPISTFYASFTDEKFGMTHVSVTLPRLLARKFGMSDVGLVRHKLRINARILPGAGNYIVTILAECVLFAVRGQWLPRLPVASFVLETASV